MLRLIRLLSWYLVLLVIVYIAGQLYAGSEITTMRDCIEQGKSELVCAKEHDWAGKIPQRND